MPLLNDFRGNYSLGYCEDTMQANVEKWLLDYTFWRSTEGGYSREKVNPKTYREVHIPEIGRRSDLIVYFSSRKVFNIECKLFNVEEVVKQAKDHLYWADYSYICFPHNVYMPNYQKKQILEHGIGLLYWIPEFGLVESIMAEHNKSKKDKLIRKNVLRKLKKIDMQNSQQHINF
jgi:hypothetical protein